ncbi:hypothetical protein ACIGNX_16600 [Actinosynnema sp. NPDC053489]|uniref:hypothetical protein n=1 Tax=Actinosynnema sp. NPDC053489 TaxID=3363916 RepID=UPI0037CB6167
MLAAVGLPYAAVHRTAPAEVLMEYVDGRSGTELTGGRHVPADYSDSPDGRLLGLVDHVIANRDRNADNWIRTDDGRLVGIDHGAAFDAGKFSTSPFARSLYDHDERTTLRPNEFTPTDMDHLGKRLAALRPEFESRGRADWHDSMMRRHHDLAHHATGTTDLITAHPRAENDTANPHHHEGRDHTATHHNTAGHSKDVTPPTHTDHPTTPTSLQDTDTHGFGGPMPRNTNITHPGAHVGSQHDVHHATTRFTTRTGPTPGHHQDVTDHDDDQDDDQDDAGGTRNVATGNDHVTQQVGLTLTDLRRPRRR